MNVTSKLSPPLIQGCPHSSHQLHLSSITIFITSSIDSSPSSPFSSLAAAFHLTTLAPSFFFLLLLPLLPVVSCCPYSFVHPPLLLSVGSVAGRCVQLIALTRLPAHPCLHRLAPEVAAAPWLWWSPLPVVLAAAAPMDVR